MKPSTVNSFNFFLWGEIFVEELCAVKTSSQITFFFLKGVINTMKNEDEIKTIVKIILVAEERLRELGYKIVDDDGSDNSAELEEIEGGKRTWIKL